MISLKHLSASLNMNNIIFNPKLCASVAVETVVIAISDMEYPESNSTVTEISSPAARYQQRVLLQAVSGHH